MNAARYRFSVNRLTTLLIIALHIIAIYNIYILADSDFFRHDSGLYLENFGYKFIADGRWLIFIFFSFLKLFSGKLLVFIFFLSAYWFFYSVSVDNKQPRSTSALFALLCISSPPLYNLLMWPLTPVLSFFLMSFILWFKRHHGQFETMAVCGVLSFGVYSNLHFLLPLIFLKEITKHTHTDNARLLLYWITTFILGFLFANLTVYIVTSFAMEDGLFIQIDEWRQVNAYANSTTNLMLNLDYNLGMIKEHIMQTPLGFVILLSLLPAYYCQKRWNIVLWMLLIFLSFYASNLYHGLIINYRSVATAFIPLFAICAFSQFRYKTLIIFLILAILSLDNFNKVSWYSNTTRLVAQRLAPIEEQLKTGARTAVVHWNPDNHQYYELSMGDKPYGVLPILSFSWMQMEPYLLHRGFSSVAFEHTHTSYTGKVRSAHKGDALHIYME